MTIDNILNEGIKYFKFSARIDSYIKKLDKKKVKDGELSELISQMKVLQKSFKNLELEYKQAETKEQFKDIKARWQVLKVKNEKLIALLRKDEIKKTAIIIGVLALLLSILLLIKKGIDNHMEEVNKKLEEAKKLGPDGDISGVPHNTQYDENGKRIVPEQIYNPNLAKPIESFKGYVMPEPGEYSKNDLMKIIKEQCDKYKFPFEIAKEVAKVESTVDTRAISPDGNSLGLMQINIKFKEEFISKYYSGKPEDFNPFDPKVNAECGIRFLKKLIKDNNGDIHAALMDYNGGPNRVKTTPGTINYADKIMFALGKNGTIMAPKAK